MRDLTAQEQQVIDFLGDAWNMAQALPPVHPADLPELAHHIHGAQNIIMARPVVEAEQHIRTGGMHHS